MRTGVGTRAHTPARTRTHTHAVPGVLGVLPTSYSLEGILREWGSLGGFPGTFPAVTCSFTYRYRHLLFRVPRQFSLCWAVQ